MSYFASSRWVAKLCRNAWLVARSVSPVAATAPVTVRDRLPSWAWCCRSSPDRGSVESLPDGNRYRHLDSAAPGSSRASAAGRHTRPARRPGLARGPAGPPPPAPADASR